MKQNFIIASAVALLGLSSCINSQEAYDKAKLSDFVAAQTTQIVEEKAGAKHSMSEAELDRMVEREGFSLGAACRAPKWRL